MLPQGLTQQQYPPQEKSAPSFPATIVEQAVRIQMASEWMDRTWPIEEASAFAVLARKHGPRREDWKQEFATIGEMKADFQAGQAWLPSLFDDALTDCYAGLNLYYKPWRCNSTVRWIPGCFVDLDYYKSKDFKNPAKVIPAVLEVVEAHRLPTPTITHTGRGLLLRWPIVPMRAWPENQAAWDAVQRTLHEMFEVFGADINSMDAARVTRIDGTINSKSGQVVYTPHPHDEQTPFNDLAYTLGVFIKARKKHRKKKTPRYKSDTVGVLVPRHPKQFTIRIESLRRIADLEGLIDFRVVIAEGHRRDFTMFFTISAKQAGWPEQTIVEQAHLFSGRFETGTRPFTAIDVDDAIRAALKPRAMGYPYRWKSATMALRLEVTEAEQAHLVTIVNEDEAKKRKHFRMRGSDIGKAILRAFEKHPGARQVDLAEITSHGQGTVSKHLKAQGLKTQPKIDGRGSKPGKRGKNHQYQKAIPSKGFRRF